MLLTRRRVRIDKESLMPRLETLIRSIPMLPLMAVAALCAAAPAYAAEERAKPGDSLVHSRHEAPQAAREPAATTTQPVSPQDEGGAATAAPSKPSGSKAAAKKKTAASPVDDKPATMPVDTAKPMGASGSPTQTVTTPDADKKTAPPERKK
jgi:hypothetical protein